jgi:acyl-CoA reductase-like NAD-dependent aldehyde dehydrogenase
MSVTPDSPQQPSLPAPGSANPATGAPLEPVAAASTEQVRAAVTAARAAQSAWAARPFNERAELMLALAKRILERRAEVMKLMSAETGRDETECLISEITPVMGQVKGHLRTARVALAAEKVRLSPLEFPGKKAWIEAVPRGVVGIIAPWNYPLGNFMKSLYPALLSGNAVVLKPSEHTPRTGAWLAAQCAEVLPKDLVGLVQGAGPVGVALLESGIDSVVFTGSVPSGRKVAARCGELLIPCSVELGGKDAAIVLADCNLERTVLGVAQWALHNAGQNCAAIERVYVEEAIADRFVEALGRAVARLRVAPQQGPSDLGPLQNEGQLRIVEAHVADAVAKGAKLVCGGKRTGAGLGFQPTVLDRCDEQMQVVVDETFGPVIALVRVKDAEEAIARANQSRYGLNGSVWTTDLARGTALARRLEVGVALVNNHAITGTMSELPWTGTRETVFGVAQSRHAYPTYVRRRAVFVDSSRDPDPWWMPASGDSAAFGEAVVEMALGSLGATFRLLGLLKKRVQSIRALAAGQ